MIHFTVNDKALLKVMGEILGGSLNPESQEKLQEILDSINPQEEETA